MTWCRIFAAGAALITWRTGGLEVAVVRHAGLNTLAFLFEAALRQDFRASMDRSAGVGEAAMLAPVVVVLLATVVIWMLTRRTGPARTPGATVSRIGAEAARIS
ncbi:hypothetical protein [Rhodococcus sp. (in: high G+C Gram-positive bacteria)]|uniref:hypothetical protein n=1 Tax=Rhodococcus sp. TaxID=1831 RepID=UPI00389081B0